MTAREGKLELLIGFIRKQMKKDGKVVSNKGNQTIHFT